MLLDEVHVVPANTFRKVLGVCKSHCKLGLTGTLVREDGLIDDIGFLIGPRLYEANWKDLTEGGYLAKVKCEEIWCEMTAEFYREYLRTDDFRKRRLLYVMNPSKFRTCEALRQKHEKNGDKIIIFSDDVFALKSYSTRLGIPFIYGQTKEQERSRIFTSFRHSSVVNTVAVSKVGDVAIDLPEATVVIQISSHFGSRRQETQRMGRILRPKGATRGKEFDAFFYTLVSGDTEEVAYSAKRQQYLIDQGYSFDVVKATLPQVTGSRLAGRAEELALLHEVLCADLEADRAERDEDAAVQRHLADAEVLRPLFSRNTRTIAAMTGADDEVYFEYSGE
jgi:DNA excision repair protein ERCC-3